MIQTPDSLSATIGELDGEIDLQWDPVNGANSYLVELSKNKRPHWEQVDIVALSRYTVTGLKRRSIYRFRIAAINSNGMGKWCKPVSKKSV